MALVRFRAAPLPNPPPHYDQQYIRQVIRVLENYFSQLDSLTPNQAQSYRADNFYGGNFNGDAIEANNVTTTAITSFADVSTYLTSGVIRAQYGVIDALQAEDAELTDLSVDNVYGGKFYGDGRFIEIPYNQFTSDSDQTAPNTAVANAVTYDNSDFPDGISINNSSEVVVAEVGIYRFDYSIQFENDTNDTEFVDIWFRKNGTDIASSNSRFSLPARKSSGTPSTLIAVTPYLVDLAANDYIQIMWRPSVTTVTIQQFPAVAASGGVTPAIPATPSVILLVTHVSAQFPPTRTIHVLPVLGFGGIGTISVSTP